MDDRELLELAAKAAGQERSSAGDLWSNARGSLWNPLADDGDALRLAVKLSGKFGGIAVWISPSGATASFPIGPGVEADVDVEGGTDSLGAATRRAIVRAAAEIGKAMP